MFTLLRVVSIRRLLIEQLPAMLIAIGLAELFYKFHSFTLECIAFLITWYITDALLTQAYTALVRARIINDPSATPIVKG